MHYLPHDVWIYINMCVLSKKSYIIITLILQLSLVCILVTQDALSVTQGLFVDIHGMFVAFAVGMWKSYQVYRFLI